MIIEYIYLCLVGFGIVGILLSLFMWEDAWFILPIGIVFLLLSQVFKWATQNFAS